MDRIQQQCQEKGGSSALESAVRQCGLAVNDLGRVAQATLTHQNGGRRKPSRWDLAVAGVRARRAVKEVERLASVCAEAADETSGLRSRIDEAWRRDAIRALLALQRAPETLQLQVCRKGSNDGLLTAPS